MAQRHTVVSILGETHHGPVALELRNSIDDFEVGFPAATMSAICSHCLTFHEIS